MEHPQVDALVIAPRTAAGPRSFDDFYRAEFPKLVPLARALCGPVVADDIAQEAMLAAYRKWRRVSQLAVPEAWVRRICANLAVSAFRRRVCEVKAAVRLGRPVDISAVNPDVEAFWSVVRGLPRRQAQVAALRYVYDLRVAEIAEVLQVSEGSVKQHLSRGRAALVAQLGLVKAEEE